MIFILLMDPVTIAVSLSVSVVASFVSGFLLRIIFDK